MLVTLLANRFLGAKAKNAEHSLSEWGLNKKKCSSNETVFFWKLMLWSDEKSKNQKIYRDPKKLSSFKNAGKPAFSPPNFNAATSLCRKKFIKSRLQSLTFRVKVILFKNPVKWDKREQTEFKVNLNLYLSQERGYFLNAI